MCVNSPGEVPTAPPPDWVGLHRSTKGPTVDAGTAVRPSGAEVSAAGGQRCAASGRFEDHIRQD